MKFCVDCKFFRERFYTGHSWIGDFCLHPNCVSLIDRHPLKCAEARGDSEKCGKFAWWFEPKEGEEK